MIKRNSTMYSSIEIGSSGDSRTKENYRMTHSLSMDDTRCIIPKTENNILGGIKSLFGSFGNFVSKIPNFMTSINNTLSVTVLPNSTITSEDLLRNLTGSNEHLSTDKMFTTKTPNINELFSKSPIIHNQFIEHDIILHKTTEWLTQLQDHQQSNDIDIAIIESLKMMNNNKSKNSDVNDDDCDDKLIIDTKKIDVLNNKKMCTEKFNVDEMVIKIDTDVPESQINTDLLSKKSLIIKSRRKYNTIAKSRKKGRGKVQLRKSGVSQTKHRKERIKHNLYTNIQDDLDAWEGNDYDKKINDSIDDDESNDNNDTVDGVCCRMPTVIKSDLNNSYEIIPNYPMFIDTYVLGDSSKIKNLKDKNIYKSKATKMSSYKVEILPEPYQKNLSSSVTCEIRQRSISESSVDSEDSIVFADGPDDESDDDDDDDDIEYSDYETSSDEEASETEKEESNHKVRFNLEPTVHTMVQWNFAYRAARRGPWEQMARDRDRFRGRIHCVGRVLDHILTTEHRDGIWQERFATKN